MTAPVLQPVEVWIVGECTYKAKPCGRCGRSKTHRSHQKKDGTCQFKAQRGCATCGKPKSWAGHLGAPESFNLFAGRDPHIYRAAIDRWSEALDPLLDASGLPRPLERVTAEGVVSFGDEKERDQGNFRVIVEKALGDALVRGGWLEKDTWAHYEFGGLQRHEEPGLSMTRLILFPTAVEESPQLELAA
jgi:hypothetical protein